MSTKQSKTTETAMTADPLLAPVIKQMCKYCKKYKPIGRTNNGFNLQGDCELKGKIVWKDDYCTNHDYNGC